MRDQQKAARPQSAHILSVLSSTGLLFLTISSGTKSPQRSMSNIRHLALMRAKHIVFDRVLALEFCASLTERGFAHNPCAAKIWGLFADRRAFGEASRFFFHHV
jgi:hypothetical protein